jgi:hypothetical protein
MPRRRFENCFREGMTVEEIGEIFDVNPAFAKTRVRTLKL